jgi:hypothetical protein
MKMAMNLSLSNFITSKTEMLNVAAKKMISTGISSQKCTERSQVLPTYAETKMKRGTGLQNLQASRECHH